MNITIRAKKRKKKTIQQPSNQDKKLLQITRRLNKQKKKEKKERKKETAKLKKINNIKRKNEIRERKIEQKLQKQKNSIKKLSDIITSWLTPERIEALATYTGYIKRSDLKILPLPFILTLAFSMYNNGSSSLIILAANMNTWFQISITAQALSSRMSRKETVFFLKTILIEAMALQIENGFKNQYANLFSKFTSVNIEDSTQIKIHEKVKEFKGSGGSASTSAMKLNTVYNISNHTIRALDIVPGAVPDQELSKNVKKQIKKGDLWIRDLGYFSIDAMRSIHIAMAFFLSRLKKGIKVYLNETDETPQDIETFLKESTEKGDAFDKDIYIGEEDLRLKVRIIGEKVPEEVKQKRIDNYKKNVIKRDKKKKMKDDYIVWYGYSIFITNVPREILASASIVMAIYRIRWQIELFFKRIKSILEIHIIKGETKNRVYCIIYSKLIALFMSQLMISYAASMCEEDEEISEYKLMKWFQDNNRLGNIFVKGEIEIFLNELILSFYLLCKNKRKTCKSTLRETEEAINVSPTEIKEVKEAA
jgi:hypothetical protein